MEGERIMRAPCIKLTINFNSAMNTCRVNTIESLNGVANEQRCQGSYYNCQRGGGGGGLLEKSNPLFNRDSGHLMHVNRTTISH